MTQEQKKFINLYTSLLNPIYEKKFKEDTKKLLDNWISEEIFGEKINEEWYIVEKEYKDGGYKSGIKEGFRLSLILFQELLPQPPKE